MNRQIEKGALLNVSNLPRMLKIFEFPPAPGMVTVSKIAYHVSQVIDGKRSILESHKAPTPPRKAISRRQKGCSRQNRGRRGN